MLEHDNLLYKQLPKYANGGGVRTTMQEVHVNPAEVHHMDELQGGPSYTASGRRSYKKLGRLFKNLHMANILHHHVAEHRAMGGPIGRHEHASAANGRYGDTELVEMDHNLVHLMNHAQGGATYNPWDGKPEYFLGGLFKSLGSKLMPMAGKIGGGLLGMAKAGSTGGKNLLSSSMSAFKNGANSFKGFANSAGRNALNILPSGSTLRNGAASVGRTLAQAAPIAVPAIMQHRQDQQMMRQQQQMMQQAQQPEPEPQIPMRRQEEAPVEDYHAQDVSNMYGGSHGYASPPPMRRSLMAPPPPSSARMQAPGAAEGDSYDSDDDFQDARGGGANTFYGRR